MTVASQLRLASGVVIAALLAILAVALYVPRELNESANEKYVRDAIPLRSHVNNLVLHVADQKAAADGYVLTGDEGKRRRYTLAQAAVRADFLKIEPYQERLPRLDFLMRRALADYSDFDFLLAQEITGRDVSRADARQIDDAFNTFRRTADLILQETVRFVADAESDQNRTYRQLIFAVASLGVLGLALSLAILLLVPRRVGQLYESEQRSRIEAESRSEAARALEHVSDGVILTSSDGVIEFWNPGATEVTGIPEHAAIGRSLERLLPEWERLARQPDAVHSGGGAAVLPMHLGHERWVSITSVDFGEGVVYAIRDVTEERALERMRSDFVATASHELRTPLTSISGAARTLVRHSGSLTHDRREAFLQMIVTESDRLARIVDQILLASRLEAGQIEVASEPCDALDIARSVVEAVALRAPSKIQLRLDGADDLSAVDCDPDRLRQVLGNLLDNAVKYSPEGGDVRVALRENGEAMRFAVHDQGLGFDASAADAIFERFRRLDPRMTRGIGGTGLGLYICRELVERMGGRIWAESKPGHGSSFYFELPLAREAVSAS